MLSDEIRQLLPQIHIRMASAAERMLVHSGQDVWQGVAGNWISAGIGSSIDYHDHRAYQPGDDPRSIDWRAYARSDQYVMKLYREEVAPRVDIVLDVSDSMFYELGKAERVCELLYYCLESARQMGAAVRVSFFRGSIVKEVLADQLYHHEFPENFGEDDASEVPAPDLTVRSGALRFCISDLLFPGDPEPLLVKLAGVKGRTILFVPFTERESAPKWHGNMRLEDVETGGRAERLVSEDLLAKYMAAYQEHFQYWKSNVQRFGMQMARVPAEGSFFDAVEYEAIPEGVLVL